MTSYFQDGGHEVCVCMQHRPPASRYPAERVWRQLLIYSIVQFVLFFQALRRCETEATETVCAVLLAKNGLTGDSPQADYIRYLRGELWPGRRWDELYRSNSWRMKNVILCPWVWIDRRDTGLSGSRQSKHKHKHWAGIALSCSALPATKERFSLTRVSP